MSSANATRRDFLKTAAVTAGAAALAARPARAASPDRLRIGIIGVGRRGAGAGRNCVESSENVVITAIGDLFPDQLESGRAKLATLGEAFQATDATCFHGWDAYQKVIDSDVDIVLLTAPPGFRPLHYAAAVKAGKHVFMEKPGAVDPAGVRALLAITEEAQRKGLSVVAGTQRRHQQPYREILKRVHDGAIGDLVSAQVYWVGDYGYYPAVLPQPGWSEMEAQMRNWNYFTWLSGDHIVEQHLHNIDIMNWAFQGPPIKAIGMGGRQQRTGQRVRPHLRSLRRRVRISQRRARAESLPSDEGYGQPRRGESSSAPKGIANPRRHILGENPLPGWSGENPIPTCRSTRISSPASAVARR
jgi:myo-inositol 2-dehydrogenase/D-chiro-inositol 1-dehydrogenase